MFPCHPLLLLGRGETVWCNLLRCSSEKESLREDYTRERRYWGRRGEIGKNSYILSLQRSYKLPYREKHSVLSVEKVYVQIESCIVGEHIGTDIRQRHH